MTGFTTPRFDGHYAQAAMPARYAIELGDWERAPRPSQCPFTTALTHFARGLGAARSGDAAAADKEVHELTRLRDALKTAMNETERPRSRPAGPGSPPGSRSRPGRMKRSASYAARDSEDKNETYIVIPARIVPARELLGEMLLELKRPADALKEFEASHVREPERFRGYGGAGQASRRAPPDARTWRLGAQSLSLNRKERLRLRKAGQSMSAETSEPDAGRRRSPSVTRVAADTTIWPPRAAERTRVAV